MGTLDPDEHLDLLRAHSARLIEAKKPYKLTAAQHAEQEEAKRRKKELIDEYRRKILKFPTDLDTWLSVSLANPLPELPQDRWRPENRYFTDLMLCRAWLDKELHNDGFFEDSPPTYTVYLRLEHDAFRGFPKSMLTSPIIPLASYTGYKDAIEAPEWVTKVPYISKTLKYQEGFFFQPRSHVVELVKVLAIKNLKDDPRWVEILEWCERSTYDYYARQEVEGSPSTNGNPESSPVPSFEEFRASKQPPSAAASSTLDKRPLPVLAPLASAALNGRAPLSRASGARTGKRMRKEKQSKSLRRSARVSALQNSKYLSPAPMDN